MRLLYLLSLALPAAGQTFTLADDAAWRLGGDVPVTGSLFLWHGNWQYEVPREVVREGDRLRGWLAAGPAGARIDFTIEPRSVGERLELVYTVRRTADSDLRRGLLLLVTLPLEPVRGRAIRFTHAPAAPVDGGFSGAGRGFSLNLTDQHALAVRCSRVATFERRGDQPNNVAVNLRLLPADFPAGEEVTITLEAALTPAESDAMPWELAMREPLEIRGATADPEVAVHRIATVEVDLAASYDNPFDPSDVAVDAEIHEPGGRIYTLPGYWHQDYQATWQDGAELLEPAGEPGWRVRFAPRLPGRHFVFVRARDRTGDTAATRIEIDAVERGAPGFIGVGGSGTHFARDTGEGMFLIGHNVPTYLAGGQSMADALDRMAAGGENFTRPWMYSAHLGLEWGQPAGTYRLHEAWRLDNLFELARERGINLLLCFDTHQDFQERIVQNPYHVDRGGPIREPLEFFTHPEAKRLYQQRLRYIVARWAACTNLVAWEFVNEIEGWRGFAENQPAVAAWHSEMADYLRSVDPYAHPITTSCWTTAGHPTLWNAPGIDFIQAHHYSNGQVDMAQRAADIVRQLRRDYPGRLLLFGEMGIHYQFGPGRGDDEDPAGVHLHQQSWSALMEGSASVPVNWWHESYIDPHDLYGVFRGIRRYADSIDFTRSWRPLGDLPVDWVERPQPLTWTDLEFNGSHSAWSPVPADVRFVLDHHGGMSNRELLPDLLHGTSHAELRIPFVFEVDLPQAGSLFVTVGRCSRDPRLRAWVDDALVLDQPFPTGEGHGESWAYREQWDLWESVYNTTVEIPIPAGQHTVRLENVGGDWMALTHYRLTGYVSNELAPAGATGLTDGRDLLLWVRNKAHWWLPVARGDTIEPLAPVRVAVPAAGDYRLEQWNTVTGELESTREVSFDGPEATLVLGPLASDVALKLLRR